MLLAMNESTWREMKALVAGETMLMLLDSGSAITASSDEQKLKKLNLNTGIPKRNQTNAKGANGTKSKIL